LAIDPKNIAALSHKGNALAGLGKYNQDIIYYDKVLAIDPKNVAALASVLDSITSLDYPKKMR
jgi:tetratricopeptide (TPR) repeat protein